MLTFVPNTNVFWILVNVLTIFNLVILADVIVSWAQYLGARGVSRYNPWVRALHRVTDPVLEPVRRLLPPRKTGGFDLSALLVLIAVQLLQSVLYTMGASQR